jgi:hypothetical protein
MNYIIKKENKDSIIETPKESISLEELLQEENNLLSE